MRTKTLFTLAVTLAPLALPAWAESDLQTSAYRNSIAQDEVRRQAEEVRQQLGLLLEDIQQNQIDSPELALAREAATKLSTLSDEQIIPLIQMLKDAGTMNDQGQVQGRMADASKGQKNVATMLKALSDGLNLHKDQTSMLQRLEKLVLRQTTNLRQTVDIAGAGKPADKLPSDLAALAAVTQTEQNAIRSEVELANAALERVAAALPEGQKAGFAAAFEEMNRGHVVALSVTAADDTAGGKFPAAVASQGKVKDALQEVLIKLKSAQSPQERAQELAAKMKELANQQTQLSEATKKADEYARKEIREQQRKLTDELAATQKEMQNLDAGAASEAAKAATAMRKAADEIRDAKGLNPQTKDAIAAAQTEAAKQLEKAGAELNETAAELAKNATPQNAAQAVAELNQLSQQIAQAQAQASAPNANKEQLEKKVEELQKDALPVNSAAANALGQAAAQLDTGSPQAAAQKLAEANAEVQKQMQEMAQAAQQQQGMQALSNQIANAKTESSLAQQTMKSTADGQAQSAAIKQMDAAQNALQQAQAAAAAPGSNTPPDVKKALADAQKALGQSKLNAAQLKKGDAMAANAKAQESMQQAMGSLQQAMSGAMAKAMPGQPGQPGQPQDSKQAQASQQPGEGQSQAKGNVQDGKSGGGFGESRNFMGNSGGPGAQGQVVTGLKPKEREAVALLQKEKAPAEYQGMAQQYLKNLASGETPGQPLQ